MQLTRACIGAAIGAALGAIIWILIGYYTAYEVSYVAWLVGLLAGMGVRKVCHKRYLDVPHGIIAVFAAALAIMAGKYFVVDLHLADVAEQWKTVSISREVMVSAVADQIVAKIEAGGHKVKRSTGPDPENTPLKDRYPPSVWAVACEMWDEYPEPERQARIAHRKQQYAAQFGFNSFLDQNGNSKVDSVTLFKSFSIYDVLWFGLATITAFKLGRGSERTC
jgi:hypothetical protein